MLARIIYSSAPRGDRWYHVLLRPLLIIPNLIAAAWIFPAFGTVRLRWSPGKAELVELLETRTRPVIFYSWHAYELLVVCAFRGFPKHLVPFGIGHDGWRSRALQRAVAWFGIPVWVYRRNSTVRARTQLIDFISSDPDHRIAGLIPDAGGPYGKAKEGFLEVARETGAILVPIVAKSRPIIFLNKPARYACPIPFARVEVSIGEPLDGAIVTQEQCEQGLMEVDHRAHGVWSSEPVRRRAARS